MSKNIDDLREVDLTKHTELPEKPELTGWQGAIANFFQFQKYETNFRTEILAGVTTFMTMAYILVVNPLILSDAIFLSQPKDLFTELVVATAISTVIGTLVMALYANYPFAMAPGMGLNAFFAYSVVLTLKIDWRLALSAVLVEGIVFIALTLTSVRRQIVNAIPLVMKSATSVGIGLFIAYIGLSGDPKVGGAGIIVANAATKTGLGNLKEPATLMAIGGIFIASAFIARRVKGALLWAILATALLGWILGVSPWPQGIAEIPTFPKDLFGQAISGITQLNANNFWDFLAVLLVFLFVDIFDTVGTLSGVGIRAGYVNEKGEMDRVDEALLADAIGTTAGAIMGTSTVTTFAESAAGVEVGGRTGFTALIVSLLFIASMIFIPIFKAIPPYATTPALVITGVLMMSAVSSIRWGDPAEAIPAFFTIFLIPLTYSIGTGLAVGFITYPVVKTFQGKVREVSIATWILAAVFVARFVFMSTKFG